VAEPGTVGGVGGVEGGGPLPADLLGGAVVHRGRGVQADPGVAVHVVVVLEERRAERSGVLDRAEAAGEVRAVLERLELRLGVGVVVRHVRTAVAAGDTQIDEQLGDRLGGHRGAPVGVQGELVGFDAVAGEGVGDEGLGQLPGLGGRHHPADDVAAEDVDDHVELVVDAALGAAELGDVPRPDLQRPPGDQLGLLLGGMGPLAAALPVLAE